MSQYLLVFLIGVLAVAIALALIARRDRTQTGLPAYSRIVSSDTSEWRRLDKPLFSPQLWLTGKPDYILESKGETIPVEVKPNRVAPEPYLSDVLQLMAYGQLIAETFGVLPTHGLLKYRDNMYRIEFTGELQAQLFDTLEDMRSSFDANEIARNHQEPGRCRVCGYRDECGQEVG